MTTRRRSRLLATVLASVAATTLAACSSGTTDTASADSSSSAAPSVPASVSVPPGVPKDSVLDLNSTKDMTGVVTTVPINQSPYVEHLPDICKGVTPEMMRKLSVIAAIRGFTGTQLVTQGCTLSGAAPGFDVSPFTVGLAIYTNNIQEILAKPSVKIIKRSQSLPRGVIGTVFQDTDTDLPTTSSIQTCRIVWGTFYGAAAVLFTITAPSGYSADTCARAVDAADVTLPAFPTRPSQMRAAP